MDSASQDVRVVVDQWGETPMEALRDHVRLERRPAPGHGWQQRREQAFARHTSSLPPAYFPQGMVRRERVMRWARDRWEDIGGARREASGSEGQP